ncbi:unnamed protein product [Rotaria magnacalcarata]|uniref:Peptidase S1 domain-containing protein n=1 Tax=Rotaria magnacalcarata TaxID=392030 RepID=A0A815TEU8_9BILA|nr:unnamed protein product [Rotaria magnacalcarata]CAF2150863.1 unnamed protein product [Rotaria magnacalcarata]
MSSRIMHLAIQLLFLFISHIHSCKWLPTQCGCAKTAPSIHSRIVGGKPAVPHSWPWIVSIRKYGSHICGGVLINSRYLLSAAHCFKAYHPGQNKDFTFAMGHNAIQERYLVIKPKRVVRHKSYNSNGKNIHDIALIELEQAVSFNDSRIGFACLPLNHVNQGESYPPIGKETWVVGWGTTQFGGKVSPTLLQVSVPITNNQGCKQVLSAPAKQICAGYDQGGKDSCQGDSGGPLVVEIGQGIFELIGLVSFGIGCAKAMKPGVYTRVAGYIDWINDVLKSTSSNSNPNPNSTYPKTTSAKPTYPEPTHPISKPLALSNTISNYQKLSYLIISIEILLLI